MTVSRLYAHSKNYDMDLTLDYNVELFPLQTEENFALALSSSLARGGPERTISADVGVDDTDDKERDVWRPDGKGRRGLEDDYDYVMYGKVRKLSILALFFLLVSNQGLQVRWWDGGNCVCCQLDIGLC